MNASKSRQVVAHPAEVAGEGAVQVARRVRACGITMMLCHAGSRTPRDRSKHDAVTRPASM